MKFEEIILEAKETIEDFLKKNSDGIIIIRWATATGKSKLSVELSKFFDIEIISADSRQIFKYMDIGTDKISLDIRKQIPHYQIDIINPDEYYTAGQWQKDTKNIIKQIQKNKKIPFIVWGTGLYIDTLYKNFSMPEIGPNQEFRSEMEKLERETPGYLHNALMKIDPNEAEKLHPNSTRYIIRALEIFHESGKTKTESFLQQNVDQPILMLGIWREKEETNNLIDIRINEMIKNWLVEEVQWLLNQWYTKNLQSMQGIGYKEVVWFLEWEYNQKKMIQLLQDNTHYLAKKQRTWFRRYIDDEINNPKDNVFYKVFNLE